MGSISTAEKNELLGILNELIQTISSMKNNNKDYLLTLNGEEAKEWIKYLRDHVDWDEVRSLEKEISDRLFLRFDVQIEYSALDDKRVELMKRFIDRSNEICGTDT